MSVTVASLYNTVCFDLLEDLGLSLGIVTQQEFLDMLGLVLMDFLRRTAMIRRPYTQQISSGTGTYTIPELNPELFQAFVNAQIVNQTDVFDPANPGYASESGGTITRWHQDQLPIQQVAILPTPNFTGTVTAGTYDTFQPGNNNLTVIVSSLASKETWGSGDTLDTIPDTFTPYLVYGVLEKIFSMDGESKDEQRALYCRSRYEEGITLGTSIISAVSPEVEQ